MNPADALRSCPPRMGTSYKSLDPAVLAGWLGRPRTSSPALAERAGRRGAAAGPATGGAAGGRSGCVRGRHGAAGAGRGQRGAAAGDDGAGGRWVGTDAVLGPVWNEMVAPSFVLRMRLCGHCAACAAAVGRFLPWRAGACISPRCSKKRDNGYLRILNSFTQTPSATASGSCWTAWSAARRRWTRPAPPARTRRSWRGRAWPA